MIQDKTLDRSEAGRMVGDRVAPRPLVERAVVAFFVASGAASLMYQVVWSRDLILVFGNTTQAISTIVTAFMLGLGLGAWAGGRLARTRLHPLVGYAICELGVGAFALGLPFAFDGIAQIFRTAYSSLGPTELALLRFGLAMLAVTPATFLMGVTLPLLTRYMVRRLGDAGPRLAELYAANTLGAVTGTLLAGLVLIEILGLRDTSYVAVALNVLAGAGALLLARGRGVGAATIPAAEEPADAADAPATPRRKLIFAATCVSGFVSLALEVLWTRMLAEGTGSLIYIFVLILALYLFGIAAGSSAYRRFSSARRDTFSTLGLLFAGIGLAAIGTVILGSGVIGTLPDWLRGITILPATLLMGYTFPLSGRLVTPSAHEAGSSAGLLYAWNTAGSIFGSFAAAFLLAATIGTNRAILVLAAASLLLGAGLVISDPRGTRRHSSVLAANLASLALVCLAATMGDLPFTGTLTQNRLAREGVPTTHLEDSLATVDSVGGPPADRRLYVTGVGMTNLTIDTRLMAYLPKILRPQEQHFLVICFGMGSAYRSGLLAGLQTDAVELSPSVPSQMPVFFPDAAGFLDNPRGRIITADGRNYVRLSDAHYDAIVVDPPPPPQSAGTVVLYTREFLEQGKARLTPGGVFLLWVPYVNETVADLQDHLRTFRAVFPHVQTMFGLSPMGLFLLGSDTALTFDDPAIREVLSPPAVQADLAAAPDFPPTATTAWPAIIRRQLWLADGQVDRFVGPGPLITDDRPRSEYFLLRRMFGGPGVPSGAANLRAASGVP